MWTNRPKCIACGRRFTPQKEQVYTVEERQGVFAALSTPAQRFDVMDCPRCGCQNALAVRLPKVYAGTPDAPEPAEESEGMTNEGKTD